MPHIVDTLDEWRELAAMLAERGYTIYQMQYGTDRTEGFHIWFYAPKKPLVEIVTHDAGVEEEMLKYRKK